MAAPKSPAFQFYTKEWLSSSKARRMGAFGRGVYIDLLAWCFEDGTIPDDPVQIARMVGEPVTDVEAVWPLIRACFQADSEGRLYNTRLQRAMKEWLAYQKQQSEKGARGNVARWGRRPARRQRAEGIEDSGDRSGDPRAIAKPSPASASASEDLDQMRTSYGRAREPGETVDNLTPPHEERGDENGKPRPRPKGTDFIEPPPGSELAWYRDEERWRKVERAVRILWTNPTACDQMLQEALTVPKARRDRVNDSASDTLANKRAGNLDPAIARRDLIAAIKGLPPKGASS